MTDNPFTDQDREKLLLIVLTDTAERALERTSISDGSLEERISTLEEHLKNLDHIDLFKWNDKKIRGGHLVALPVNGGEYTLLLKLDDGENYFVCIGIDANRTHPVDDEEYCYRLGGNASCILPDTGNDAMRNYLGDAVDHAGIFAEVAKNKYWRPFEGNSAEERKWRTYLNLYKTNIEAKKVSFCIKEITIQNGKLRARLDGVEKGDLEKIKDAEGEDLDFSLSEHESDADAKKLGRLVSVHTENLEVDLEKSFEDSLEALTVAAQVADDQNEPAESKAREAASAEKKKKGAKKKECPMPSRMCLSANFVGDLHQVRVMESALQKIKKHPVWMVLSGERVAKLPKATDALDLSSGRMNDEQKNAVNGALNAPELFLIWGPPGTGKTEVIMEIAKQESLRGHKTLICSQANLAVDNALARLYGASQVYPFRIAKEDYELEGEDRKKVPFADSAGRFFLAELQEKLEQKIADSTEDASIRGLRAQFLTRVKNAQKTCEKKGKKFNPAEVRQHGELYKKNINVVGTTLMGAGKEMEIHRKTGNSKFDTVIIDEVSKATPPELFIPVSLGKRLVLVGDHKQLPPMFEMISGSGDHRPQEEWAEAAGIPVSELDTDSTIFQRLWDRHTDDASPVRVMLTKQYRMHPDIQALIEQFYTDSGGKLEFGFGNDREAIAKLTLQNVDFCKHRPAIWIGTRRDGCESKVGTSFVNYDEVEKVGMLLDRLAASGDRDMSVGVITFYGAQLRELRKQYERNAKKFGDGKLIFGTVDRFQGRECDVIICSLVRNNKHKIIGFASKVNRINVAFSRAKKSLIILGRHELFCHESHNVDAQTAYNEIYNKCNHPKPKELEGRK